MSRDIKSEVTDPKANSPHDNVGGIYSALRLSVLPNILSNALLFLSIFVLSVIVAPLCHVTKACTLFPELCELFLLVSCGGIIFGLFMFVVVAYAEWSGFPLVNVSDVAITVICMLRKGLVFKNTCLNDDLSYSYPVGRALSEL